MKCPDPKAVQAEYLAVAEHVQLLVVGAGPAGAAAAIEAANAGLRVMLVDEHPVDANLMRLDVPWHFGGRMDASVQNRDRILRQITLSNPALEEAYLAGVDVRLATDVWGLFTNCADVAWLPGPTAGLADATHSWMVGFERAVIAAGRRDLGLAFPGWQLRGVTGIAGAAALLDRYDAFTGRSLAILGTCTDALAFALRARSAGFDIKAIVEAADRPAGAAHLVAGVCRAGIPLLLSTVPTAAEGADEVCALSLVQIDGQCQPISGTERSIPCDTICLGIGVLPNVEAIGALGGELTFQRERGGYVPLLDNGMRTSIPCVFAAGDCTGITCKKSLDSGIARAEGRLAAQGAIASLTAEGRGAYSPELPAQMSPPPGSSDLYGNLELWLRAIDNAGGGRALVCQCEEITRAELVSVAPPKYIDWPARRGTLASLREGNALSQDQIKRLTRVGMGYCQGRRCREQAAVLLANGAGLPIESIAMPRFRPPLRPLPLAVLQDDFHANLAANWDVWFGIRSQWKPYWSLDDPPDERGDAAYGK